MISHLLDRQNGENAIVLHSEKDCIMCYHSNKHKHGIDEDTEVILHDDDVVMLIGFLNAYLECRTKQNEPSK